MSNILVTGGGGFIGGHLVDRLVSLEHNNVVVLDNFSTGNHHNPNAKEYCADISELNEHYLINILSENNIEYIFHLAAQINLRKSFEDPLFDARTNVLGTMALASAAKKTNVKKFVFASTGGAIYSENQSLPWNEESLADPQSPYGLSKLCAEKYLQLLCPQMSIILRFSNVYGPRQNPHGEAGVVAIFLDNMLKDKPCCIFGDGTQIRDYIYVHDVVDACVLSTELTGVYNVSTDIGTDLNTLTLLLLSKSGIKSTIKYEAAKPGEMEVSILDSSKLQSSSKWRPKTELSDGIQKTVDWFMSR